MEILYMSGYMKSQINKHNFSMDTYNFIQKPFSIQDFLEKVKTILKES
jgi:DNA-binding NtrC family response regulator